MLFDSAPKFEKVPNPNYFWIGIPNSELTFDFSVEKIELERLTYLDEMAEQINNYWDSQNSFEIIRAEIPKNTKKYGDWIIYFIRMPDHNPQIVLGAKDHPHILNLEKHFYNQ